MLLQFNSKTLATNGKVMANSLYIAMYVDHLQPKAWSIIISYFAHE